MQEWEFPRSRVEAHALFVFSLSGLPPGSIRQSSKAPYGFRGPDVTTKAGSPRFVFNLLEKVNLMLLMQGQEKGFFFGPKVLFSLTSSYVLSVRHRCARHVLKDLFFEICNIIIL